MANTFNFGNGTWATKEGSALAYNAENGNYKPLPFDFDRASKATRVNKEGLIEVVGRDKPRIDYKDDSKGAMLLEPQRTNLLQYSEQLSNWTNIQNVTVSDNDIISPDGTQNASKVNETTSNSVHRLFLNPTVTSAKHTYSVFLKKGTRSWAYLRLDGSQSEQRTWFDLENGVLGTVNSDHIASMEDFGNGWYRCSVSIAGTTYDTTPLAILALAAENNVLSYVGSTDKYIYAWGAMLEQGSYPTSYIPNYGTAAGVTRSADDGNSTGDISSAINEEEGVFFIHSAFITSEATSPDAWISLSEGSSNNSYISIRYDTGANLVRVRYKANGGGAVSISTTITDRSDFNKIAFRWKANDFSLWINGSLIQTQTTWDIITANNLNRLSLELPSGGQNLYGNVKEIRIYDEALSDSELQKLTTL